jgi:hypothetical protein
MQPKFRSIPCAEMALSPSHFPPSPFSGALSLPLSGRRSPETQPRSAGDPSLAAHCPPQPRHLLSIDSPTHTAVSCSSRRPHTQTLAPPAGRRPQRTRPASRGSCSSPTSRGSCSSLTSCAARLAHLFGGLVQRQGVLPAARRWKRWRDLRRPSRAIRNPTLPPCLNTVIPPPPPKQLSAVAECRRSDHLELTRHGKLLPLNISLF